MVAGLVHFGHKSRGFTEGGWQIWQDSAYACWTGNKATHPEDILNTSWTGGQFITGPSFWAKPIQIDLRLTETAKGKPWNPCNNTENLQLCTKRLNAKMWQNIWVSDRGASAGRTSSWLPTKGLQGIRSAVKLLGEILMALAVPAVVWTKYRCGLTIIYIYNVTFHSTTLNSHQGL